MRRFFLCSVCVIIGLFAGATLRFPRYYTVGFQRGRADALVEMQLEAVREGHGRWERDQNGGPNRFAWNAVRGPEYSPESVSMIPGVE